MTAKTAPSNLYLEWLLYIEHFPNGYQYTKFSKHFLDLFQLINEREGRSSIMIVSQIPVANWFDLFEEATFVDACLDRICHKAYRLEFNGEILRRKSNKN